MLTAAPGTLQAALDSAARGWKVFPLRPGTKRPALHGETRCSRTGACAGGHVKWEERATTDPERITRAWAQAPFNIGLATGPSGLVVVDLDMPKNGAAGPTGAEVFAALCERAGQPVPVTFRTGTASGGQHFYFAAPDAPHLGNSAGLLGELMDTRAWGGYVVAPGSVTPSGAYTILDDTPVLPLPDWLLEALTAHQEPARPRTTAPAVPRVSGGRAARAALERECRNVQAAPAKQANNTLNRSAFLVGRFVAWGDLDRLVVEEAFQGAGESRGLTTAECRATIRSALDSSIRKARPREAT
ncbi:DNA primase [Streptomyces sp. WAC00288]|uniref:bifunctional DNA primase/polymerase n=1 Tax=unclassified Streptomyces TaxID=2593676 RepID=UPI0007897060|nr:MULTISPECIES: bifunctional DNA primase/polymerase [unclassified Streptomyces]AVH97772.1 DNA primase [Streptomyces sp. WAC00288]KYG56366.1 DNA primase [Streptomyces sp. WAC04657]